MLRLGPNMTLIFIFEFNFVRTGLFDRVDTKVLMSDKSEPYCKGGFTFNAKHYKELRCSSNTVKGIY